MKPYSTRIIARKQISPDTFIVTFSLIDGQISFTPGQYIIVKIPQGDKTVNRIYSLASSNTYTDTFELFIKHIPGGVGSTFLVSSPLQTVVSCLGPAGLFQMKNSQVPKVFMTTGTGFAPVRSFILSQSGDPASEWLLLWGDPHASDIGLTDELIASTHRLPSFRFYACLSQEESLSIIPEQFRRYFKLGRINKVFDELKTQEMVEGAEFYLCGSRTVVEGLKQYLLELKIPLSRIIFEKY